jgi:membrane-associated protein
VNFNALSDFAVPALGGAGPVQPHLASFLPDWLNPQVFLADPALAPWVVLLVCGIIFAETGLLIGFFLPGDSMLFTAGLLVATDTIKFNIWLFAALIIVAAIIGNQTGYLIGSKAGPAIFNKPDSRLFKHENIDSAHKFFEKHGGKALILARFVPIIPHLRSRHRGCRGDGQAEVLPVQRHRRCPLGRRCDASRLSAGATRSPGCGTTSTSSSSSLSSSR